MKNKMKLIGSIAFAGLFLGICYLTFTFYSEKNDFQEKYEKASQKNELLLQKVKEEKSKIAAMMHKNRATEAQHQKLYNEIDAWEKKYAALEQDNAGLKKKLRDEQTTLIEKEKAFSEKYTALEKQRKECENNYKEAQSLIATKKKEIKENKREIASLEAKLKRTHIKLSRAEEKNSELCDLSSSLLDKFENQSVLGSIMKNENFVQLKRVEIEKIAQEYQDKIEDLTIEKTQ